MDVVIAPDDPSAEDVHALLERHLAFCRRETPPGHVFALDRAALVEPAIVFFSARRAGTLLGIGALKRLDASHAELKSMHTSERARRQGVGRAMLAHLLAYAAKANYQRVSLETGTMDAFAPARALYARFGFEPCGPFGDYTASPYSAFMSLDLARTRERFDRASAWP